MNSPLSSDASPVSTEGSPSSPHRGEPMMQQTSPSAIVVSPSSLHRGEPMLQKIIPDAISSVHSANPVSTLQASLQLSGLTAGKIGSLTRGELAAADSAAPLQLELNAFAGSKLPKADSSGECGIPGLGNLGSHAMQNLGSADADLSLHWQRQGHHIDGQLQGLREYPVNVQLHEPPVDCQVQGRSIDGSSSAASEAAEHESISASKVDETGSEQAEAVSKPGLDIGDPEGTIHGFDADGLLISAEDDGSKKLKHLQLQKQNAVINYDIDEALKLKAEIEDLQTELLVDRWPRPTDQVSPRHHGQASTFGRALPSSPSGKRSPRLGMEATGVAMEVGTRQPALDHSFSRTGLWSTLPSHESSLGLPMSPRHLAAQTASSSDLGCFSTGLVVGSKIEPPLQRQLAAPVRTNHDTKALKADLPSDTSNARYSRQATRGHLSRVRSSPDLRVMAAPCQRDPSGWEPIKRGKNHKRSEAATAGMTLIREKASTESPPS